MPGLNGHTVLTAPSFLSPEAVPIARACQAQYARQSQYECATEQAAVDWSYLCPPAMLTPGLRTGQYRVGSDTLVTDSEGNSAISMEDFVVAMMDEAETRQHASFRFTDAY